MKLQLHVHGALLAASLLLAQLPLPAHAVSSLEVHLGRAVANEDQQTTEFDVTLATGGAAAAGLDLRFGFDPDAPVAVTPGGSPDCTVNPAIRKRATSFTFLPRDCGAVEACNAVDVVVLALDNVATIPDGSRLFSCRVAISGVTGVFPLSCIEARYSTPPPAMGIDAGCVDGEIVVADGCAGDCNGNGAVTIDESLLGVNIALGNNPLDECPPADTNADGAVGITDLVVAIGSALHGCLIGAFSN